MPTYFLVQILKKFAGLHVQNWEIRPGSLELLLGHKHMQSRALLVSSGSFLVLGFQQLMLNANPSALTPPTFPFAAAHSECCESRSQNMVWSANIYMIHEPQELFRFGMGITDSSQKRCILKWKCEDVWKDKWAPRLLWSILPPIPKCHCPHKGTEFIAPISH